MVFEFDHRRYEAMLGAVLQSFFDRTEWPRRLECKQAQSGYVLEVNTLEIKTKLLGINETLSVKTQLSEGFWIYLGFITCITVYNARDLGSQLELDFGLAVWPVFQS